MQSILDFRYILVPLAGILIFVTELGAAAIHIWTVVIGYQAAGLWGAILSLCAPFLSEIWWFRYSWQHFGLWGTWYAVAIGVVVAAFICWILLAALIVYLERRAALDAY